MIIIGDLHLDAKLGNIKTLDLFQEKVDKLVELINKEDMVVFLGDYFNSPEPHNEFRKVFSEFVSRIKIPKRFILGNHDIDNATEQNSLVAIEPFLQDEIVSEYEVIGDVTLVAYLFDFDKLGKIVKNVKTKYVVGHFSFEYELGKRKLKGELDYDGSLDDKQFILGHIHKFQQKGNITYLGSFVPHKLDELEYEYKIALIKDGEVIYKNVKHNIKQKVVKTLEDLKDVDDRTNIILELKDMKDKEEIVKALKEKKIMNIKYVTEKQAIDTKNLNIDGLLKEYLETLGRGDLFDRVRNYIEKGDIQLLLEEE